MIPLQMLLACLLGWLEAEQRDVIAFLREENRVRLSRTLGHTQITTPMRYLHLVTDDLSTEHLKVSVLVPGFDPIRWTV